MPSAFTTTGKPNPSPISVTRMTPNATNKIRSRYGKASPPGIVNGNASAAANETAPRTPVNAITKISRQSGSGSRLRSRLLNRRGR